MLYVLDKEMVEALGRHRSVMAVLNQVKNGLAEKVEEVRGEKSLLVTIEVIEVEKNADPESDDKSDQEEGYLDPGGNLTESDFDDSEEGDDQAVDPGDGPVDEVEDIYEDLGDDAEDEEEE